MKVINAGERADLGVVIVDGYGHTIDKAPCGRISVLVEGRLNRGLKRFEPLNELGVRFDEAKDEAGKNRLPQQVFLSRPQAQFSGWDKQIFFFTLWTPNSGLYTLTFTPGAVPCLRLC